jgi:hypothetical protein
LTGFREDHSEHRIAETLKEIEVWALEDRIFQIFNEEMPVQKQLKFNRKPGSKKIRQWQENELLKTQPLLCGMWKYFSNYKCSFMELD